MGPDRVQPSSAPPVDLLPPQLHAPGAQNQGDPYAGFAPPQQYMHGSAEMQEQCITLWLDIRQFEVNSEIHVCLPFLYFSTSELFIIIYGSCDLAWYFRLASFGVFILLLNKLID